MIAVLIVVAVSFASTDSNQSWAFVYGPLALLFLPAIYASVTDTLLRRNVLRASTIAALLTGLSSAPLDFGIPLIIAPPMTLLAQGAGLIFQRRNG